MRRTRTLDLAIAGGAGLVDLALFSRLFLGHPGGVAPRAVIVVVTVVSVVALVLRKRHPIPTFVTLWVLAVSVSRSAELDLHPTFTLLVAFAAVVRADAGRAGLFAWAALLVPQGMTAAAEAAQSPTRAPVIIFANGLLYPLVDLCVWWAARQDRRNAESRADAELQARVSARAAIAAERTRIAHELHDIVAHSVTVMVLQAGGGRRVIHAQPDQAASALQAVEDVGKQAMAELRQLLVVLRASDPDSTLDAAGVHQHGLADLDQLLDVVRSAGVAIRFSIEGAPHQIVPSLGLAVYRTVQEALTNVTKHAGAGTSAEVVLSWAPTSVTVHVQDDGAVRPGGSVTQLSTGHGLVGLGERIKLLGGQLTAGPRPQGGFQVTATFPLPEVLLGRNS